MVIGAMDEFFIYDEIPFGWNCLALEKFLENFCSGVRFKVFFPKSNKKKVIKIVVDVLAILTVAGILTWVGIKYSKPRHSGDYSDCSRIGECQGYLYGVPTKFKARGLNVLEARKIANNMGEDARVIVAELDLYDKTHPDLPDPKLCFGDKVHHHATNVAGIILGQPNGWGVTGIAPKARAVTLNVNKLIEYNENPLFPLERGDIITCSTAARSGDRKVPAFDNPFWWEGFTRNITRELGVHVIQSAGNDNTNYDEFWAFLRPGSTEAEDTGIILVGGLDPSSGERASFSNYGSRIPLNAWGWNVITTGENGKYRHDFWGTSAATPQISGCVALLESTYRAKGFSDDVEPERMRQILFDSGDEILYNTSESTKRIGRLPDMVKALGLLHPSLGPVRRRDQTILFG